MSIIQAETSNEAITSGEFQPLDEAEVTASVKSIMPTDNIIHHRIIHNDTDLPVRIGMPIQSSFLLASRALALTDKRGRQKNAAAATGMAIEASR